MATSARHRVFRQFWWSRFSDQTSRSVGWPMRTLMPTSKDSSTPSTPSPIIRVTVTLIHWPWPGFLFLSRRPVNASTWSRNFSLNPEGNNPEGRTHSRISIKFDLDKRKF